MPYTHDSPLTSTDKVMNKTRHNYGTRPAPPLTLQRRSPAADVYILITCQAPTVPYFYLWKGREAHIFSQFIKSRRVTLNSQIDGGVVGAVFPKWITMEGSHSQGQGNRCT